MILFLQLILLYKTTKTDLLDNTFYLFKTNRMQALYYLNFKYYKTDSKQNGKYELFNLEYSEYIKIWLYQTLDLTKKCLP
jgi:hypothetical protein